ncbi:cupin domain-containing protein [Corynebacterium pygosceleis]|uniref:cupin domain-containing protein n=1 Tax=Corynebacterium pygosceleis TaxID=2800406 RepID=UPI002004EF42|nr:cupin domain-containing protein [Corynebacterium pygosceleis]MCK7674220.1 cupin domain-containing protein [Corynebacterium pygosceleis]
MDIPVNQPDTFGEPERESTGTMTVLDLLEEAADANPDRRVPAVKRILEGNGANIITFSFAPGQRLNDHKAAHPITVQCLRGTLDFSCDDTTVRMTPGTVLHLDPYVMHRVQCPDDTAEEQSILLLHMLTGETP